MRFLSIVGTRPEIIKMAPVIREINKRGHEHIIVYTGQHNLLSLTKDLGLPKPNELLDLPPASAGKFKGNLVKGIFNAAWWSLTTTLRMRRIFKEYKPEVVLYQGDTLAIACAALAAKSIFRGPMTGHIEAGLRTRNLFNPFPEEFARRFADKFSDLMFAPTKISAANIAEERLIFGKIFVTGNTVVDASLQHLPLAERLKLKLPKKYCVVFIHRQENVHVKENLEHLLALLKGLKDEVLFIKHPTVMQKLKDFGLEKEFLALKHVHYKEFYDYLPFIKVLNHADYVLTDSGGLQEESCTLKFPCIVWRKTTERPEAVDAGAAVLVGDDPKRALRYIKDVHAKGKFYRSVKRAKNPFGDGTSAEKIVELCVKSTKVS